MKNAISSRRRKRKKKKSKVAPVQQNMTYRQIAGYKSGVSNTINQISYTWNEQKFDDRPEYKRLIELASDLKWRLEQLEAAEYGK